MKKILIATAIALAATAASALEIGTTVTRDYAGTTDRNVGGITLGHNYGATTVTAGFERFTAGTNVVQPAPQDLPDRRVQLD